MVPTYRDVAMGRPSPPLLESLSFPPFPKRERIEVRVSLHPAYPEDEHCHYDDEDRTNVDRRECRDRSSQQSLHRDVFIKVFPVNSYTLADQSPLVSLLICSIA